jgi:hypothetical protein
MDQTVHDAPQVRMFMMVWVIAVDVSITLALA